MSIRYILHRGECYPLTVFRKKGKSPLEKLRGKGVGFVILFLEGGGVHLPLGKKAGGMELSGGKAPNSFRNWAWGGGERQPSDAVLFYLALTKGGRRVLSAETAKENRGLRGLGNGEGGGRGEMGKGGKEAPVPVGKICCQRGTGRSASSHSSGIWGKKESDHPLR